MDDDFTITVGGLTLCQTTIFRWCERDDDSGKLVPVKGGTCACGADRLPVDSEFELPFPEREESQWKAYTKATGRPFPHLILLPPYNPEQEDE